MTNDDIFRLLELARTSLTDPEAIAAVDAAAERLHGPLRVAIAGKIKAGKSTLLNALVGERLAPTDAGECTRIVTWYRDGATYRVNFHRDTETGQVPFRRDDGALEIDLQGRDPASIDSLEVEWPSSALTELTFIDTPGIDSINTDISARTERFLTPDDAAPRAADAVVYLMRHVHQSDVRFLEAFHDEVAAQASAINAIGVLSRADEIGVGRIDALMSSRRIASRHAADPKLRRLVQTVVPIAGLLAETAVTLRQDEFRSLETLAAIDRDELDDLLLSVDRFVSEAAPVMLTAIEREALLGRFGIFGIRLSCGLIRQKRVTNAPELAEVLADRSGLHGLREILRSHFTARSDVLRARSALMTLRSVLDDASETIPALEHEFERVMAGLHEFAELDLLGSLRSGGVRLRDADRDRAERLLGIDGTFAHQRLGGDPASSSESLRVLAVAEHQHWLGLAESPLLDRDASTACRTLTRTCEGLIVALSQPTP